MQKRGYEGDVIKYFLIAVIIIAILLFGYNVITKIMNKACSIETAKFKIDLDDLPKAIKFGTVKEFIKRIPCNADEVYFFDQDTNIDYSDYEFSPLIKDSIKSDAEKNVFLVKDDKMIDSFYSGAINIDFPNYICFIPRAEKINFFAEGKGKFVNVFSGCFQPECTYIPVKPENKEAVEIIYEAYKFGQDNPSECPNCPIDTEDEFAKFIETKPNVEIFRKYEYCKAEGKTNVEIIIKPKATLENFRYYESIPKECIDDLSAFLSSYSEVGEVSIKYDPLIIWSFDEIRNELELSYVLDTILSDECREIIEGLGIAETIIDGIIPPPEPFPTVSCGNIDTSCGLIPNCINCAIGEVCVSDACVAAPVCTDIDIDGFGNPASPVCTFPDLDCDDGNAAINPAALEACSDTIDNNCDLKTDCLDITNCEGQSCGLGKICTGGACVPPGTCGGTDISCGIFPSCADCTLTFQICDTATNTCINPVCGNNIKEGIEVCDGTALGGETCISQGFASGNLACNAACTDFDTGGCIPLALSLSPISNITFLGFITLPNINLAITYNGPVADLSSSLTETNPSLVDCNIVALNQIKCDVMQNIDGFSDVIVQVASIGGLTATDTFRVNVQETYRELTCERQRNDLCDPFTGGNGCCDVTCEQVSATIGILLVKIGDTTKCKCNALGFNCKDRINCYQVETTACEAQPICPVDYNLQSTSICIPPVCTDTDGDGYGDPASPACTFPDLDCDNSNPNINPGMSEIACDTIDQDCLDGDFVGTDNDGDTYKIEGGFCGAVDCDDGNFAVNPGAVEVCTDDKDNNCNAQKDCAEAICDGQSCGPGKVCSLGFCVPNVCADGTPINSCSIVTPGVYCDSSLNLIPSCNSLCPCASGTCSTATEFCEEPGALQICGNDPFTDPIVCPCTPKYSFLTSDAAVFMHWHDTSGQAGTEVDKWYYWDGTNFVQVDEGSYTLPFDPVGNCWSPARGMTITLGTEPTLTVSSSGLGGPVGYWKVEFFFKGTKIGERTLKIE